MPAIQYHTNEVEYLKSIVSKTPLVEETKWGGPVYTYNGINVLTVGGMKPYFGVWFFNGVLLKDPHKLLINAQEGKTKAMRQIRFTSVEDVNESILLDYIKEAIDNAKKGLKVIPEKKAEIKSDILDQALKQDNRLANAFKGLTPYKQNEFREYIESAKQENTRFSRMEKIKSLILQGIGLNDKYRKK